MTGYKTKVGCLIVFLGGLIAVLTGAVAEPLDPTMVWGGITTIGGAFAGWGVNDKAQRYLHSKGVK